MSKLIAWSPDENGPGLIVGSVRVNDQQKLTLDLYLSAVSDRVQRLVNLSPDPAAVVRQLEDDLASAGLWYFQVNVNPQTAGEVLVYSNPPLWEVLSVLLELNLPLVPKQEQESARQELERDKENPSQRLRLWAGALIAETPR